MRSRIITSVLYCVFLLFGAISAQAATCTVNVLTDTGAGSGGAGGTGDLRYCITQTNAAGGADTINAFLTGTILLNSNLPYISDSLTINGGSQIFFIIDAQSGPNRRGFEVDAPAGVNVTLRNLTIRNGNITSSGIGSGGGISLISGATLNLDFVTITNNVSVDGGAGINVNASNLNITNSRITGNNSTASGAGGGGINFFNGTLFMSATTISGNTASNGGGIAFVFVNPARIENSTISGNNGSRGGGFYVAASTVRLSNATISNNTATELGGGFVNASTSGSTTLRNCTVAGNIGTNSGGGFYNFGNTTTVIANTIIADNSAINGADVLNSFSGIVIGDGANIVETGFAGSGGVGGNGSISQVDPLLNLLVNNGGLTQTQSFAPNSPARDAGVNGEALNTSSVALTTDQRGTGFSRFVGSAVDIGAYEFFGITVTKTEDTNDGVCDADCSLREAIATAPIGSNIQFSTLFDTPQMITLGSLIVIGKTLTIIGPGANKLTISGNNATTLFENFSASEANINFIGMTFANGNGVGGNNNNQGGAVEMHGTSASFDRVVFRDNTVSTLGGALLCFATTCRITNSTFYNNSAPSASVLYGGGGTLEMTNTTISGNIETNSTYGTLYLRGTSIIRNSTIANNPGRSNIYVSTESVNLMLANTIIAGSAASDIVRNGGIITTNGGNFIGNNILAGTTFATAGMPNANSDFVGTNVSPINPQLAPLGNYGGTTPTRALLQNSLAINNGTNCVVNNSCAPISSFALATDQRGALRQIGSAVDIGAFEANITIAPESLINGNTDVNYNQQFSAIRQTNFAEKSSEIESFAPTNFEIVTVAGQSLPPGMMLSPSGLLSGTPTAIGIYSFTVKATDTDGVAGVRQYILQVFGPTAANVSISGRISAFDGNGIRNVIVTLTDANGNTRTTRSSAFGYYQFDEVESGETYVISVVSKRFTFAQSSQILTVNDELTNVDFIASNTL